MNVSRKSSLLAFAFAFALAAGVPIVAAAAGTDSYGYAGAGVGYGRMNGADFTDTNGDLTRSHLSWKVLAGAKVTDMLSVEGQYIDFGAANRSNDRIQATGWTAGIVAEIPVSGVVVPYVKVGALFWKTDNRFNNISRGEDGTNLTAGLGARFMLSSQLALRAEYERFAMDHTDIDNLSVSMQYHFF